ncbi:hypothetical protein ACTHGU_13590 [Chitinophagaceae bacterium MMS25-I14]
MKTNLPQGSCTKENNVPQPVFFSWSSISYSLPDAASFFHDIFDAYGITPIKDALARIVMYYVQQDDYEIQEEGASNVGVLEFLYEWLCRLEAELVTG